MTFRVWYRDGSARLVSGVESEEQARDDGRKLAERDAQDIIDAWAVAPLARAKELKREWEDRVTVQSVEQLC